MAYFTYEDEMEERKRASQEVTPPPMTPEEKKRWEAEKLALPAGIEPQQLTYAVRGAPHEMGGFRESIHYSGALPGMPGGTVMEHPNLEAVAAAKQYGMNSPQYQALAYTAAKDRALRHLETRPEESIKWMESLIEGGRARDIAQLEKEGRTGYASEAAEIEATAETKRAREEAKALIDYLKGGGVKSLSEAGRGEDFNLRKPTTAVPALPGVSEEAPLQQVAPVPVTPTSRRIIGPEDYREHELPISRFLREMKKKREMFEQRDRERF